MSSERAQRHLSCIMFTDMVGYSALAQADERKALELLAEQRRLVRPLLARHQGREIKSTGDGFLVEFSSAVEATECAIAVQRAMAERNAEVPETHRFQIRIGLHVGDVVIDDQDVFGDGVNIASRIEACAPAGGIAMTSAVAQQVENKVEPPVVLMGPRRLKNIRDPVTVYRVALPWDREALAARGGWGRLRRRFASRRVAVLVAAVLALGGLGAWWLARDPAPVVAAGIRSLAVLPLENLSNDPEQAYFVDGMQDALIAELSRIAALRVISRTSTLPYGDRSKTAPEIGRELKVDALIEGSVVKAGDRVRITVQLIGARDDAHLWARSYDRELKDVLDLQGEIVREIADEIRIELTPAELRRFTSAAEVNPQAHEAYLRGRWYRDAEDLEQAHAQFDRAISLAPDYAPAWVGNATYWSLLPFYSDRKPADVFPRARQAALRALELDEDLPEAHAALAYIRAYSEWDWPAAEREFKRALELSPSAADVHFSYSRFLTAQRRFEDAHRELERAYELDPTSLLLKANIALLSYFERDYDLSLQVLDETLDIDPEFPTAHWGRGLVYEQQRRYPDAIAEMERAAAGSGRNVRSSLGHLYGVAGRRADAEGILADLEEQARAAYVPSYYFALLQAGLGQRDAAIGSLEQAYAERSSVLAYLLVDPRLDGLRADPRFQDLRKRLRFPT